MGKLLRRLTVLRYRQKITNPISGRALNINTEPTITIEIFMNEKWIVFEQREGTGNQVRFGDRMVDADGLSEETLEWLDWYLKILYNRN